METNAQGSEMDKVRAELICSMCLDLLCEPKKLDCDHSFCEKCLEVYVKQPPRNTPEPAGSSAQDEPRDNVIVCACCLQETRLSETGVAGLKTNFKLKSLVDILTAQEREKTIQELGKNHHRKLNQVVPKCQQEGHESEHCVFFCQVCSELFCRYCIPRHRDAQHSWDNYDSVLLQFKEELRWSIQPAYEAAQSANDAMIELEKDKSAVVQNADSVKGRVREYFSQLAAELQQREQTIVKMTDRYAEVKLEQLQKHYRELKRGKTSLLQNIQKIETQMQEDSVELLTGKDSIKAKMILHRNMIRQALPKSEEVDTFIELKVESQVPVATLGHLVFCQRNPRTGLVSTVRNFVESKDMAHIHLDLAQPSEDSIAVPHYIQFRYRSPLPLLVDDEPYEELAPAVPAVKGKPSQQAPRKSKIPLPPEPFGRPDLENDDTYCEVGGAAALSPGRKRGDSECLEVEDPYDTIPALGNKTFPSGAMSNSKELIPVRRKPSVLKPERVFNLGNANARVSGIVCTQKYRNIVITDTENRCLQILSEGNILYTIGPPEVELKRPVALAIDSTNDLFVLDQESRKIHKIRLSGDSLLSFSTQPRRGPEKPWDIAISPDNTVYISDWSRRRIYAYNSQTGKKIRSIKGCYKRDTGDKYVKFSRPAGLAFDLGGRLMVVDRGERCVWCINLEGDELIKVIGETHLQTPYGIAVAKDGKIVVTESESDCVSVFGGENGELLHYFGGTGTDEGLLCGPHHVFVDENMKIYVADTQNRRVQIFSLPEDTVYQNMMLPAAT